MAKTPGEILLAGEGGSDYFCGMVNPEKNSRRGIDHLMKAAGWSMAGLRAAFYEEAFRQELFLCLFLAPLAMWLGKNGIERALLLGSLFLVLIVEILNSAVESAVDRIGVERHPLSGRAKDLGSAAVFLSLVNVVVVWLLVLLG